MEEITIRCKKILGGVACGEAMVSRVPISWVSEVDETDGKIVPKGHELEGMNVGGKILIYPEAKGSTFAGVVLRTLAHFNCQPKAIIMVKKPDHTTIQGIIMSDVPAVCLPDKNPLEIIRTGDFVEVNATEGLIKVMKK
jgi:predicted aconitase with swiveling domain